MGSGSFGSALSSPFLDPRMTSVNVYPHMCPDAMHHEATGFLLAWSKSPFPNKRITVPCIRKKLNIHCLQCLFYMYGVIEYWLNVKRTFFLFRRLHKHIKFLPTELICFEKYWYRTRSKIENLKFMPRNGRSQTFEHSNTHFFFSIFSYAIELPGKELLGTPVILLCIRNFNLS